jgi:hypothetical protein
MKKKGHHTIPDFSTKRNVAPSAEVPVPKVHPVSVPQNQAIKPHATSKKSGRRGS